MRFRIQAFIREPFSLGTLESVVELNPGQPETNPYQQRMRTHNLTTGPRLLLELWIKKEIRDKVNLLKATNKKQYSPGRTVRNYITFRSGLQY